MRTEVLVLGPVLVRVDGAGHAPPSAIGRAILGALTVAGDAGLSSESLLTQVWGERSVTAPGSTLTVAVSRLRRWLRGTAGDTVGITTTTSGYALDTADASTDLGLFRQRVASAAALDPPEKAGRLGAAIALWRGPALADVPLVSSDTAVLDRLDREYVNATIDCSRALLATGQASKAALVLAEPVRRHPFDEPLVGTYIEALATDGRQGEALKLYEQLRQRLRDELGADPSRALEATLVRVLRQETETLPAASGRVVPAELPPDVTSFVGRDGQLSTLDGVLDEAAGRVVALTGMGGVGKTSLAVRWAHRVRSAFPDGQLYVDLHGYSLRDPLAAADVLGRFLGKLGVPADQRPSDVDDAAAMYRSVLADMQMVIVLDNASHASQVRPLLPNAPGCVAVVTSRDRLDGLVARDGVVPVAVDVLAHADATALLVRLLGAERARGEPDAIAELADACGRLPLALRVAAAQLGYQPRRTVEDYLAELRARRMDALSIGDDDAASLRATFDLSYRELSHDAKRLFQLLGTNPCLDVTAPAAAALAGIGGRDATVILQRLARAHLLLETEPGRYGFHDLLRAYAIDRCRQDMTDQVREAAVSGLLAWYEEMAVRMVRWLDYVVPLDSRTGSPHPEVSPDESRAWLAGECENVVALVRWAADHGPHPTAWRVVHYVHRRYADLGRDNWRDALAKLLGAVERTGEAKALAVVEQALARTYQLRGDLGSAIELRDRVLAHGRAAGWTGNEAMAMGDLGVATMLTGDLDRALALLQGALELSRERHEEEAEAICAGGLGFVYHRLGDLAAAERSDRHALELARRLGNRADEALQISNVGVILHSRGRLDEARDYLEYARALPYVLSSSSRGNLLDSLATVYRDLGVRDEARHLCLAALEEAGRSGSPRLKTTTAITMASVECTLGEYPSALRRVSTAHEQAVTARTPDLEARALVVKATALRGLGDFAGALASAGAAIALAERLKLGVTAANAHTARAEIALRAGEPATARRHADRALRHQRAVGQRIGEARTLHVLADAVSAADGIDAAMPYWQQAHDLYAELGMPEAAQLQAVLGGEPAGTDGPTP